MTLTKKLLLINTLICAAFLVIIIVVLYSFRNVETVLSTTFTSETQLIIENANRTRELSRILSEMNLILRTFYGNDHVLKKEGELIKKEGDLLLEKSGDNYLKTNIAIFLTHLNKTLEQCKKVNFVRNEIKAVENSFDNSLILLDNLVAERLVELMVEGSDTSDMEQISSLIGGWRESFVRIKLHFEQLGLDHFIHSLEEVEHPLLTMIDDLMIRLRTLTASSTAIESRGQELISILTYYKILVMRFHGVVQLLSQAIKIKDNEKEKLLLMMEKADRDVVERTLKAKDSINFLINRTLTINLVIFILILPIAILGGITAYSIKNPILTLIEFIRLLSKGDIPQYIENIEETYTSEFKIVMGYLNMLITATNSVTNIAENIAAGNMKTPIHKRSENDRLMEALDKMVNTLDRITSETKKMIQSVGEGVMDVQGRAEDFEGGWKELISGMNELISDLCREVSKSAALSQEMELARNIQTCLLPNSVENIHPDFEISATMIPAAQVGGDFYEVAIDREGNLRLAIGDVSGHGVTPGLIMMMAQTIHTTIIDNIDRDSSYSVVKINNVLYANVNERLKEKHFMTLNVLRYLGKGKFEHAGAHLRIIVYRNKLGKCELIQTKGIYLNLKKDISKFTENSYFEIEIGDMMILYSDGLTEARNFEGEILDIYRFTNIIEKNLSVSPNPEGIKQRIIEDVLCWCDNKVEDDMTLLLVKRKG